MSKKVKMPKLILNIIVARSQEEAFNFSKTINALPYTIFWKKDIQSAQKLYDRWVGKTEVNLFNLLEKKK